MFQFKNIEHIYPISENDHQQNSPLTYRALDEQRVSINQCQSDTPWNHQTHDCYQEAADSIPSIETRDAANLKKCQQLRKLLSI